MRILVLNAGSSSLKASRLDGDEAVGRVNVPIGDATGHASAVAIALQRLAGAPDGPAAPVDAVAHRVVHGGDAFTGPVVLDDAVMAGIESLARLAPIHTAAALATIAAARAALPGVPHVACFDTSFHAGLPAVARREPVPDRWATEWGIRRYGFHGLSVEWAVGRAGGLLGRPSAELDLVVAHLGSGCSVTAVHAGRSAWTSMGFSPLDGLMMGTRSGALDPAIVLELLRAGRIDADEVARALEHESGLLGVSGRSADVRELEAASAAGDERSSLALALFAARAAAGIAAAATWLPGLDAVVFTGGIGEHGGRLRAEIVGRLGVLGLARVGPEETGKDRVIEAESGSGSRSAPGPAVLRVEAREDLVMARATAALIDQPRGDGLAG